MIKEKIDDLDIFSVFGGRECFTHCLSSKSLQTHELFMCNEEALSLNDAVRFVQIGANDGVMMDPLHEVMKTSASRHRRWNGVFVEPVPDMMRQLKSNKAAMVGLKDVGFVSAVVNATCPVNGIVPFFKYESAPGEPVYMQGLGSLSIPLGRDQNRFRRMQNATAAGRACHCAQRS